MGTTSARQARQVLENARWVVAIELLNAAQGLDFRRPLRPAAGTGAALAAVREVVASLDGDRPLQDDLHALYSLVASGRLREAVESAIGALN
jgi:histidine ammonia-lyase